MPATVFGGEPLVGCRSIPALIPSPQEPGQSNEVVGGHGEVERSRQVGRASKLGPNLDYLRERLAAFPDLLFRRLSGWGQTIPPGTNVILQVPAGAGGSPEPPLQRKLFIEAHASIKVASTLKCSVEMSRFTRG